jgi:hypothetical protein
MKHRENRNKLELMATFSDLKARRWMKAVCGSKQAAVEEILISILLKHAPVRGSSASTPSSAADDVARDNGAVSESDEEEERPTKSKSSILHTVTAECAAFKKRGKELKFGSSGTLSFDTLTEEMEVWDSTVFWNAENRKEFPTLFNISLYILAVPAATGVQEKTFSCAKKTLTAEKTKLLKSPRKLRCKVLGRVVRMLRRRKRKGGV